MVLRVGYSKWSRQSRKPLTRFYVHPVREHFASPLLQLAEKDAERTFVLVECPGTHLWLV